MELYDIQQNSSDDIKASLNYMKQIDLDIMYYTELSKLSPNFELLIILYEFGITKPKINLITELNLIIKNESNNCYYDTILHKAVRNNRCDLIDKISRMGGININAKDSSGETALNIAIYNNNINIVTKLLDNQTCSTEDGYGYHNGMLAIHIAIKNNCSIDIIKKIIEVGAKLTYICENKNILDFTKYYYNNCNYNELINIIKAELNSILIYEIDKPLLNQSNVIKLLNAGADIDSYNSSNNTILHKAIQEGSNNDFIKKILIKEYKADLSIKNSSGETPLFIAVKNNNKDIVELLIKTNLKQTKNYNKESPLDIAKHNKFNDIIKLLENN